MNQYKPLTLFLISVFFSLMVTACKPRFVVGPEQTFEVEVPRSETGDAKNVTLDLAVPQGTLAFAGGAKSLIDGEITYNALEYQPLMTQNDGTLLISQTEPGPKSVVINVQNNLINQWDLQVSDLPINFEIRLANGEYTIGFAQSLPADFKVTINAGVGKVNLIMDPNLVTQVIIGEHTDLLKISTRGDWSQAGDVYQTSNGSAALTVTVNMRGGELNLDNK
jgi:hypothetical protein